MRKPFTLHAGRDAQAPACKWAAHSSHTWMQARLRAPSTRCINKLCVLDKKQLADALVVSLFRWHHRRISLHINVVFKYLKNVSVFVLNIIGSFYSIYEARFRITVGFSYLLDCGRIPSLAQEGLLSFLSYVEILCQVEHLHLSSGHAPAPLWMLSLDYNVLDKVSTLPSCLCVWACWTMLWHTLTGSGKNKASCLSVGILLGPHCCLHWRG